MTIVGSRVESIIDIELAGAFVALMREAMSTLDAMPYAARIADVAVCRVGNSVDPGIPEGTIWRGSRWPPSGMRQRANHFESE
ncbi:MAG: hypothetical protein AAGJ40_11405 [Planctomycetota bacterium]